MAKGEMQRVMLSVASADAPPPPPLGPLANFR